jgi:hypothetical protein
LAQTRNGLSCIKPSEERLKMPIQYSIDQHVVLSSMQPVLTSSEVEQFCRKLSDDPRFDPSYSQLHEIYEGALSSMRYPEMSMLEKHDPFSKQSLRAVVVYSAQDYGMARTYELIRGGNLKVCRSLQEATTFLQLHEDFVRRLSRRLTQGKSGDHHDAAHVKRQPTLIYSLSDTDVFRCSECKRSIASIAAGRYIVVSTVLELVATFQEHVRRHHGQ